MQWQCSHGDWYEHIYGRRAAKFSSRDNEDSWTITDTSRMIEEDKARQMAEMKGSLLGFFGGAGGGQQPKQA
jgi:hypothetical protein